ncbi:MAG: 23S rRNA (adenine(2503)-C(2))-methyltransferase RlmN [Spirochaetes bacterium]|nr:23S rRNA (adenine(2503)-C(2))-methyltransferase RlmN [Spirochaetota bacterium]
MKASLPEINSESKNKPAYKASEYTPLSGTNLENKNESTYKASGCASLSGMLPEEILAAVKPDKPYRANQIFKAIQSGAADFSLMTTLPASLIKSLCDNFCVTSSMVAKVFRDDTNAGAGRKPENGKLSILLHDKNIIECVLLSDLKERKTACISTQAGCAMGCLFCKTGESGLARDLTASEIVDQFLFLEKEFGEISNIVFMGMGEPLDNIETLFKAAEVLNHKEGKGIGYRRMTLSTCGLADKVAYIADNGPPMRLAVSLNCGNQKKREQVMPIAKKFDLAGLKESLLYYQRKRGKRITLEYVLIKGFNTDKDDVKSLRDFIQGLSVIVNIIPWNRVPGSSFQTPSQKEIDFFVKLLDANQISYSIRHKKAQKIRGACGQLSSETHYQP